jgi:hypothetical protein
MRDRLHVRRCIRVQKLTLPQFELQKAGTSPSTSRFIRPSHARTRDSDLTRGLAPATVRAPEMDKHFYFYRYPA